MRRSSSALFIGLLACLAQPLHGQQSENEVGWIGRSAHADYRERFTQLLLVPKRDLAVGWQLARDLGRSVAPLLWDMVRAEKSNVDRRLVLLTAAVLAGGPGEDARLFDYLASAKPMLEERAMACLLLSLGPRRVRAQPELWRRCLGPSKSPEQLLAVAARLAAARFPESRAGAPTLHDSDQGVMAATAFAGLPISSTAFARTWKEPDRHVGLFWRGALLGEVRSLGLGGKQTKLVARAADVLERREDGLAAERAAAMLLRARAGVLDPKADRPPYELLRAACGQPTSRSALQAWLPVGPLPRDDHPERLAVAYAMLQPVDRVVASISDWGAEPRIRTQLAVAFALRLLIEGGGTALAMPAMAEVPEWAFAVWAATGKFPADRKFKDKHLQTLAALIEAGRIDRPAVATALEEVLWRWRCHPGIAQWEQERLLIRDLLLAGSNQGGGRYLPHIRKEERYFPTGLDRNDKFFRTAVEFFEFTSRPTSPMPRQHRLR